MQISTEIEQRVYIKMRTALNISATVIKEESKILYYLRWPIHIEMLRIGQINLSRQTIGQR